MRSNVFKKHALFFTAVTMSLVTGPIYAGHGGTGDDRFSGTDVPFTPSVGSGDGAPLLNSDGSDPSVVQSLPETPVKKAKGGADGSGNAKGKSGGDRPAVPIVASPTFFPLFVIADSGAPKNEYPEPKFDNATDSIVELIRMKMPGAKIVRLASASAERLAQAWAELQRSEKTNAIPSSTTMILNTRTQLTVAGDLYFLFGEGYVSQTRVAQAATALYESISKSAKAQGELKTEFNTVLLTSYAGSAECRNFPGPIFGITPSKLRREGSAIDLWLNYQTNKTSSPFPMTAREWYEDWKITSKVSFGRFYRCPANNRNGFEGIKNAGNFDN